MENKTQPQKNKSTLGIICYILSGVLALTALILAIAIVPLSQSVMNFKIFFQLTGLDALANALLNPLRSLVINAGIGVTVITLLLAFIIFLAGRILSRQSNLLERVQRLEEKL